MLKNLDSSLDLRISPVNVLAINFTTFSHVCVIHKCPEVHQRPPLPLLFKIWGQKKKVLYVGLLVPSRTVTS